MKNYAMRSRQRGLSFIGLVFMLVVLVCAAVVTAQSVPVLLEYQAIMKAAKKAASEGGSVINVRGSFDRSAAIDDFTSVTGKDLEITKVNDEVVVGFAYHRDIHLVGPAYLVYKFEKQTK